MSTPDLRPPIGFPLLPRPDGSGRLAWPDLAASVDAQIRILLQTRPGEWFLDPRIGAGLQEFVGQPDDLETRRRLAEGVRDQLGSWEPRIVLDDVSVADGDQPGTVRIEIRYRLRRTGTPGRLGVGIALERG